MAGMSFAARITEIKGICLVKTLKDMQFGNIGYLEEFHQSIHSISMHQIDNGGDLRKITTVSCMMCTRQVIGKQE